jgi:hypothetical protein
MLSRFRKLLSSAFAALMVMGGTPRIECACPNAECRAACAQRGFSVAVVPIRGEEPRCSCCCAPLATGPQTTSDASISSCRCETFVKRTGLLSSPSGSTSKSDLAVAWQPTSDVSGNYLLSNLRSAGAPPFRLPPADPVTRAQILRL